MHIEFNSLSVVQKYDLLRSVVEKVRERDGGDDEYAFQEQDGYINLIGVRGFKEGKVCVNGNDVHDDTIFVVFKKDGKMNVEAFAGSTEWTRHDKDVNAVLAMGQHKYRLHYHKENKTDYMPLETTAVWRKGAKYRALEPNPGVRVWRDFNHDLKQDAGEGYEEGNDSINIHYGGNNGAEGWSDGCQVLQGWEKYKYFIKLVESDNSIKGSINNELSPKPSSDGKRSVIYTLVSGDFLDEVLNGMGGLSFPVDLGGGRAASEHTLEQYYTHTEKKASGGYFPVGGNTVWHGGIHIFVPKGTEVYACFPGRIVAARLAEEDVADGPYGSRNFILVKHEDTNRIFYSLYMHLKPLPSSKDDPCFKKVRWLGHSVVVGYRLTRNRNYRPQAKNVKGEEKGPLKARTEVEFVADAGEFWKKVKIKGVSGEWYMSLPAEVANEKRDLVPDEELLKKLKSGSVVKLDIPVGGNELLWWSGDHGSVFHRAGLLHWEIFSEENVFDGARQSASNKESPSSKGNTSQANTLGTCVDAKPRKFMVREVEGPVLAYPSTDVTYRIIGFEPVDLTPEEKREVNWVVTVDGKEVLKKEKHGDMLVLRTKDEWMGKKIVVMPYRNAPSQNVRVETRVANRKPIVWQTVEDNGDDFNMDSAVIAKLFGEVWSSDEEISTEELKHFYAENQNARKLRTYACKFVSEWAIPDLDRAIEQIEMFIKRGLKERLSQYQWWEEAKKAGVDLPKSPKCWHYNPVTFMEALFIESGIPVGSGKVPGEISSGGLVWGKKVSAAFKEKVLKITDELEIDPNHLMSAMAFESGETFSPSITNAAGSGAVGLIQFMPKTATALGTSIVKLKAMTAEEQLDYVQKYFRPYKGKCKTLEDVYMAILWPAAVGKPNDYVLFKEGTKAYTQNKGIDSDKDGKGTKGEAAAKVRAKLVRGRQFAS
jgi:hypothetical protein